MATRGSNSQNRKNTIIWFPKLFPNGEWNNNISDNETIIYERNIHDEKAKLHILKIINDKIHTRIVFAKIKDSLGKIQYRFKGKYILNVEKTNFAEGLIWERVSSRVKTYPPQD